MMDGNGLGQRSSGMRLGLVRTADSEEAMCGRRSDTSRLWVVLVSLAARRTVVLFCLLVVHSQSLWMQFMDPGLKHGRKLAVRDWTDPPYPQIYFKAWGFLEAELSISCCGVVVLRISVLRSPSPFRRSSSLGRSQPHPPHLSLKSSPLCLACLLMNSQRRVQHTF